MKKIISIIVITFLLFACSPIRKKHLSVESHLRKRQLKRAVQVFALTNQNILKIIAIKELAEYEKNEPKSRKAM